jgi:hypothetical protein
LQAVPDGFELRFAKRPRTTRSGHSIFAIAGTFRSSLDHPIRAREYAGRNTEPDPLGRLQIDD